MPLMASWGLSTLANVVTVLVATRVARLVTGVTLPAAHRRAPAELVANVLGNVVVSSALLGWQLVDLRRRPHKAPSEALSKMAATTLAASVWFYSSHHALHAYPLLCSVVHHVHQRWTQAEPMTTFYSHPIKNMVVTASLLFPVGAMRVSTPLAAAFVLGVLLDEIARRCSDKLGCSPHYIHHLRHTVHFGAGVALDALLGTGTGDAYYDLTGKTSAT